MNFNDSNNMSTARCVNATRAILAAYYRLSETSLDISRLHPFVTVRPHYDRIAVITYTSPDLLVPCRGRADPTMQVFH